MGDVSILGRREHGQDVRSKNGKYSPFQIEFTFFLEPIITEFSFGCAVSG
jgi:hypothetical protein